MESTAAFVAGPEGSFRLEAPLQFATVAMLRVRGLELIASAQTDVTVDLSGVPAADSAGLALLIDWLASARASNKKLRYVQLPPTLLALARLSEVEGLLMA